MRTSAPDRGPGGPSRRISAVAVALAVVMISTAAPAAEPPSRLAEEAQALSREGDHALAAERWEELAASDSDPTTRTLAAFQGYQARLAAYDEDPDPAQLCGARQILAALAERDDVSEEIRRDVDARIADLDARLDARGETCEAPPTEEETPPQAADLPALLPVVRRPLAAIDVDRPRPARAGARAYTTAGGVTLGVGTVLLGAAVYGLAVDARSALALAEYGPKQIAGQLTDDVWARIDALGDKGLQGALLAKVAGVSSGVALITGAALLLHGRRIRARSLPLHPQIGRDQAGLGLRGQF